MEQSPRRTGQTHIHLRNAQFDCPVGSVLGKVNVIDPDYFPPAGVNDLLVEQVFAQGKPALIRTGNAPAPFPRRSA